MHTVYILYSTFPESLSSEIYNEYVQFLSEELKEKNKLYKRWEDQHSNLFGKLLLQLGYNKLGYKAYILNKIKYGDNLKPYLEEDIKFNISHSGEYVLCCLSETVRLGIDIEEIKDIGFKDFKQVMNEEQWKNISDAPNPLKQFFTYWVIKESVVKADGRGFSLSLPEIHIFDEKAICKEKIWYLKEIHLAENYKTYVATNVEKVNIELINIDFYNDPDKRNILEKLENSLDYLKQ